MTDMNQMKGLSPERLNLIIRYCGIRTVVLPYNPRFETSRLISDPYTFNIPPHD